jgi:isopenicillin N synthase-like dioxygenase
MRQVPELRLSDYLSEDQSLKRRFIESLFVGLKEYGFIVLKDHPISTPLLEKAYRLVEELFNLPLDVKNKYGIPEKGFQRGYTPFGKEHAKDSPVADLKEFWHVGRELEKNHKYHEEYPENIWPEEIAEFKSTLIQLT